MRQDAPELILNILGYNFIDGGIKAMRIKNKKLEWYVLNYNFNKKKVVQYNIFYQDFIDGLYKEYKKKNILTKDDLKEFIKRYCFNYMGRIEYEIMVGDLFDDIDNCEKIDVYTQVMMNIDRIVDYVNEELSIGL